MCSSGKISVMGPHDDRLAAARIVSLMRTRERVEFVNDPAELDSLVTLIASSSLVISLRFHGAMLAALLGVPFVGISMHDKMRSFFVENELQNWCDFYGFSGEQLLTAINASPSAERMKELREEGYERWQHMSDIVAGELSL
jgi:polysaccharide pyruvyl transferase WcaK-like protein